LVIKSICGRYVNNCWGNSSLDFHTINSIRVSLTPKKHVSTWNIPSALERRNWSFLLLIFFFFNHSLSLSLSLYECVYICKYEVTFIGPLRWIGVDCGILPVVQSNFNKILKNSWKWQLNVWMYMIWESVHAVIMQIDIIVLLTWWRATRICTDLIWHTQRWIFHCEEDQFRVNTYANVHANSPSIFLNVVVYK
jgi:hypothetical protein